MSYFFHNAEMAEAPRHSYTEQIQSLLTPQFLLEKKHFPIPEKIYPENYPDFDSLKLEGERIRTLQLLPIKRRDQRSNYHSQPKEKLRQTVETYLENTDFAVKPNQFPNLLPPDVDQYVLWMKHRDSDPQSISTAIAHSLESLKTTPDGIIVFERSQISETNLVKGTYPHHRHIHLLLKK